MRALYQDFESSNCPSEEVASLVFRHLNALRQCARAHRRFVGIPRTRSFRPAHPVITVEVDEVERICQLESVQPLADADKEAPSSTTSAISNAYSTRSHR